MRYLTSTVIALVISFFTFLGMSLLISSPHSKSTKSFDSINFSMIEEMESPDIHQATPPRTPPKQEKINQPPTAPNLELTAEPENPGIILPTGKDQTIPFDLDKLTYKNYNNNGKDMSKNGDLMPIFILEPQYPIKQLKNKTEGWVKVEFTVNEFGKVSHFKILESQPNHVFDNTVKKSLFKSKFEPAMVDGKAVSQTAIQTIEFKIKE